MPRKEIAARDAEDLAAQIAAFAEDVVTRIINVHWDGGLAVEFFDNDGPPAPGTPTPSRIGRA